MKAVTYQPNPGNACALACYTMVASYLLPNSTPSFEDLGTIAGWRDGYVIWGFPIWLWLMNHGVEITDYDTIDYAAWARDGKAGLQRSIAANEYQFYEANTYDLETETSNIRRTLSHSGFTYIQQKPSWETVVENFAKPGICDLTINSRLLDGLEGFAVHRIVILDITSAEVVIHDPRKDESGKERHVPLDHFKKVYAALEEPELAHYYLGA